MTRELHRKDLEAARSGDREAFARLVDAYKDHVSRVVRREMGPRLHEEVDAEDLVQETLIRALRSLPGFEGHDGHAFKSWLGRIAHRVVLDAGRRQLGPVDSAEPADPESNREKEISPSRSLRRNQRFDRLEKALAELTEDHRRVIELARLEGLPVQEVARIMNRTPNATSMLLYRALIRLKEIFGDTESLRLPARRLPPRKSDDGE